MRKILLFVLMIYNLSVFAQEEMKYNANSENVPHWVHLMYAENPNPGEIIAAYRDYYKNNKLVKNKHTQYYKRWVRNLSRISQPIVNKPTSKSSNQWECVGPWDFDKDAASRSYAPGAAHIYTVEQSISNPNVLYAGSATAGAWKTIDKGANWELLTKDIHLGGVYAIEIDFADEDITYISGNGGVYKTIDGGINWNIIGDTSFTNYTHSVKDIKLKPNNNLELFVASNEGLFKSTDGGIYFNQIMSGNFMEIEFHPNSADTMYFIKQVGDSTLFYRSDDGGNTLINYTNGWPNPSSGDEQKRTEIAVSPAAPNKIVALATGSANGGSGLYGIYISYDKGENWIFQCCGPHPAGVPDTNNINMMGWQPDGSDDGGQYYYDLALAVNPTNADIIHVGGVNHWISFDDGVTFACPAKWSEPHKKGYVHADIHDINYFGNDLWFACDGGIFYSDNSGDSIYKKQYGIAGTDFWGFGVGFKDGDVMLGGTYHNGVLLKDHNTYINDWLCTFGGDNYNGFVNFGNPRQVYHDGGGRILSGDRTVSLTSFPLTKRPNKSYIIGESSQLEFDPRCHNWIYSGNDTTLWLSKNNGKDFEAVYHFDAKVTSIEVSWSNPDVIYVATWPGWSDNKKIYRTNDAGKTWADITIPSTMLNGYLSRSYDITVSSYNENILWVVRLAQWPTYANVDGYKVFKSIDGGQNWINLTTPTLDGHYMTNIEHQRGSNGGVYLGTRTTVFYRNDSMPDWVIYDNNLPRRTLSTQLFPYYKEGLLINGTNRSVYEIDFYENTPPSAQIAADRLTISCLNDTVKFVDHSAVRHNSASWNWSFPGGTPSSSTLENPIIVYSSPGDYDVSLQVTDAFGSSTQTLTSFITYTDSVSPITNASLYTQDFESSIYPPKGWTRPDWSFGWDIIELDTGINCTPTKAVYVNHYWINKKGEEVYLISNKVKLGGGLSAQNYLTYDYAYCGLNPPASWVHGSNDGFRIDISTNCGITWDSIYGASGTALQTTGTINSPWYPTCGSWASDSLDLTALGYNGDTIMVRFVAINDYGNRFFMDNININGQNILTVEEVENRVFNVFIYPNPTKGIFSIRTDSDNLEISIYSILGELVLKEKVMDGLKQIDFSNQSKGIYFVTLKNGNKTEQRKLIIE